MCNHAVFIVKELIKFAKFEVKIDWHIVNIIVIIVSIIDINIRTKVIL